MYRRRYGEAAAKRFALIENGYDESSFAAIENDEKVHEPLNPGRITLLHSGIVYPSERDPTALFKVLGELRRQKVLVPERFCLRFRAAVHEDLLRGLADLENVHDIVDIAPPIPYGESLLEMLRADGLVVMQGANCNEQIPAKVYEYLRSGRPVLGLTDPSGDTATLLSAIGCDCIGALENVDALHRALVKFTTAVERGNAATPGQAVVAGASRQSRAQQLAVLLESIATLEPHHER
jgi:hypothetical protein